MIGYVLLGTNDLEKSGNFYDELFDVIGVKRSMVMGNMISWGNIMEGATLGVITPNDGQPATVGNGSMVGIAAKNTDEVNAVHAKALELGGKDEGAPGPRGDGGFYVGYFRDIDGNKLNVFCMAQ